MSSLSRCVRILWCFVLFLLWIFLSLALALSRSLLHIVCLVVLSIKCCLDQLEWFFHPLWKLRSKSSYVWMYVRVYVCNVYACIPEASMNTKRFSLFFFFQNVFFLNITKKKKEKKTLYLAYIDRWEQKKLIIYTYHFFFSFFPAICVSLKKHTRFNASRSHIGFEKLYF